MSPAASLCSLQVTPVQAERCGALWGWGLLLEAHSPNLTPPITWSLHVALGGPRGHLIVQTDKPLYAPRQTGECPKSTWRSPNPKAIPHLPTILPPVLQMFQLP